MKVGFYFLLLLLFCATLVGSIQKKRIKKGTILSRRNSVSTGKVINITCDAIVKLNHLNNSSLKIQDQAHGVASINTQWPMSSFGFCFSNVSQRQTILLSQVMCRQLGYMTFLEAKQFDQGLYPHRSKQLIAEAVSSDSWTCLGHEQALCQCSKNNIDIQMCQYLMELRCGDCQKTVKDSEGVIHSPGYPEAYLFDLTCRWFIEVPELHTIVLTFSGQNSWFSDNEKFACESCRPYIEIVYSHPIGEPYFKADRYYNISWLTNASIERNKIEIRFFSGLYRDKSHNSENRGFIISFKAIPPEDFDAGVIIVMFVLTTVACLFLFLGCFYIGFLKRKQECRLQESQVLPTIDIRNADNEINNNETCEFQTCKFKETGNRPRGLRLRTRNSSLRKAQMLHTVISSIADVETVEDNVFDDGLITPRLEVSSGTDSANLSLHKRFLAKVNLLNRYSKGNLSTSRYGNSRGQSQCKEGISAQDQKTGNTQKTSSENPEHRIFIFNETSMEENTFTPIELETSVFLTPLGERSKCDKSSKQPISDLPFITTKESKL